MKEINQKCVVLLSGGIDSATCLAIAKSMNYELFALSFCYRQRHKVEIKAAKRLAVHANVKEHLILDIPLDRIGGSALTSDIEVPKDVQSEEMKSRIGKATEQILEPTEDPLRA